MNNDDFKAQMLRLIDCYGPRFYPEERIKAIYEEFKHIEIEVFKISIAYLIADSRFAPVLTNIREAIVLNEGKYRYEKRERLRRELGNYKCPNCKNSGAIIAFKDAFSYAFKCPCKVGSMSGVNWPVWKERFKDEYEKIEMPCPGSRPRT